MTEEEIAGFMGWRGPGAYTRRIMARAKALVSEATAREREACAMVCEAEAARWEADGTPEPMSRICAASIRSRSHD